MLLNIGASLGVEYKAAPAQDPSADVVQGILPQGPVAIWRRDDNSFQTHFASAGLHPMTSSEIHQVWTVLARGLRLLILIKGLRFTITNNSCMYK